MSEASIKILLIEDTIFQAEVILEIFQQLSEMDQSQNYEVVLIDCFAKAKKEIQEGGYDVIVSDLELPDSIAPKTIENLRKITTIPIVALTSDERTASGIRSLKQGAQDYLVKINLDPRLLQKSILFSIERKKMEDELKLAKKNADLANQAKSRFLASMTHDIRTPIGAIMGFNQLLMEAGKSLHLPDQFSSFQENIQICAQHLLELVNNCLDISKIEADKMGIAEEHINVKDLIEEIYSIHKFIANQKGVHLSYEISEKLPKTIYSDRSKLVQILNNLTSNAIKFTPENKKVLIRTLGDQNLIVFMVVDEGLGIPKDRQKTIFEAFEQSDNSIAQKFGGTGLGLAISKKMVEMLGGQISAYSKGPGTGSLFNVRIPLRPSPQPPKAIDITEPDNLNFLHKKTVLVTEDNAMNQALLQAILTGIGLNVIFATNGEESVQKTLDLVTQKSPPDLILMDMEMPVMDGPHATQEIRNHPDCLRIPIVALSANAFKDYQDRAMASGMNDYLLKPIDVNRLKTVLQKYLF